MRFDGAAQIAGWARAIWHVLCLQQGLQHPAFKAMPMTASMVLNQTATRTSTRPRSNHQRRPRRGPRRMPWRGLPLAHDGHLHSSRTPATRNAIMDGLDRFLGARLCRALKPTAFKTRMVAKEACRGNREGHPRRQGQPGHRRRPRRRLLRGLRATADRNVAVSSSTRRAKVAASSERYFVRKIIIRVVRRVLTKVKEIMTRAMSHVEAEMTSIEVHGTHDGEVCLKTAPSSREKPSGMVFIGDVVKVL